MSTKHEPMDMTVFSLSTVDIRKDIDRIATFPKKLKKILKSLSVRDLQKSYRPDGWTALQVVHHLADSHMNAFTRMKMAATESPSPIIKPYNQDGFAELVDSKYLPAKVSYNLLVALHQRWAFFLESLQEEDLEKAYFHPEEKREFSLREAIALYAWHGEHHLEQIKKVAKGHGVKVSRD